MEESAYSNTAFMGLMVYIKENYKKDISLSTAGQALHMNPNYISQLFKKEAGITFIHYITQLRMEDAVNLLSMTNKPVIDIAMEVGFNDYFYFLKTFKNLRGKRHPSTERNYNRIIRKEPGPFRKRNRLFYMSFFNNRHCTGRYNL